LVVVALRPKAKPVGKTGLGVAEIIGMAGAFIILGMMVLKTVGLV
jgi:hypothetical protein